MPDMSALSAIKKISWCLRGARCGPFPLAWPGGLRMNLDLRNQSQRFFGFDERELFRPLRRLMPQCRSMLDVGANDGYYTLIFLRSGADQVVACEPSDAVERLLENAAANGFAIGERFQIVTIALVGLGEGHVPAWGVIIADLPGPILIKLDVEGARTGCAAKQRSPSIASPCSLDRGNAQRRIGRAMHGLVH